MLTFRPSLSSPIASRPLDRPYTLLPPIFATHFCCPPLAAALRRTANLVSFPTQNGASGTYTW